MNDFEILKMSKFQTDKMAKVDVVKSGHLLCGLNCFEPGQEHKTHTHPGSDKMYYVLEGEGTFLVDGEEKKLISGSLLHIPDGVPHGVSNQGVERLSILVVMAPNPHH